MSDRIGRTGGGIRDPDQRALVRKAIAAGWVLTMGGKHYRLTSPQGKVVVFSGSARGAKGRSLPNFRATLRRAGLEC